MRNFPSQQHGMVRNDNVDSLAQGLSQLGESIGRELAECMVNDDDRRRVVIDISRENGTWRADVTLSHWEPNLSQ